ncbi:hypothetical protein F3087_02540 [Nocardia colli]|uniref:DUF8020 domain-containing protein n=1 Tax=Nocardia colli TaxID=2545717 RepID=A0A5N0ELD4_9NOCA|nr:hypothetical protein [Nocardia colli]KAA8890207.1 hypothetical protein F3087_02540 [Nocardia colli]
MNLRRTTAGAALVIGAMTIGLGTAHAEPVAAPADLNYSVKLVDKTVVASLKGGTFSITEKDGATATDPKLSIANVKDGQGNTLVSFPLDVDVDGRLVPVKTEVKKDGTVLEVTPQKPADLVVTDKPVVAKPSVAQDIASPMENQRAQNEFASNFGIATAIGGFVGTAIGATIGCIITIPAFCLPGLVAGAGIGGILGTIAVGGPALIAAGLELMNTFQAADGTTKWADKPLPAK